MHCFFCHRDCFRLENSRTVTVKDLPYFGSTVLFSVLCIADADHCVFFFCLYTFLLFTYDFQHEPLHCFGHGSQLPFLLSAFLEGLEPSVFFFYHVAKRADREHSPCLLYYNNNYYYYCCFYLNMRVCLYMYYKRIGRRHYINASTENVAWFVMSG